MATEVETVNIFLERVTKLETDNRRLKQIVTLIVVGAAAALIMGQSRSQPRTFEAEEFVLKDRNGELRGRLYMNGDNPVLYLKGVGEKRELWLEGGSSSGDPGLLVLNGDRRSFYRLSGMSVAPEDGSSAAAYLTAKSLLFFGSTPSTADIDLGRSSLGEPYLQINDRNGFSAYLGSSKLNNSRTGETRQRSAASLVLFGADGKVIWSAP